MMFHLISFCIGFAADMLFGDPLGRIHIVVAMGKLITAAEKFFRWLLPKGKSGELMGGALTVMLVCGAAFGISWAALSLCYELHWFLGLVVESFLCWQCLAARSLWRESMEVYRYVKSGELRAARAAVGRIVGRDTEKLDMSGVCRACVETVAENASDGVIAPLLFLAVGGAPLGVLYKAINTMDSMLGYKNERYLYFGKVAAKLDDIANFLPSRIGAGAMILSAYICGMDGNNARRIFLRDRRNHASPNSAQTEAVCAGALHLRLGGPSFYFGNLVEKPYIGDDDRAIEAEDICQANKLMLCGSALCFAAAVLVKGGFLIC